MPTNYVLLGIFTACESYCLGLICQQYSPELVMMALVATLAVVLSLTVYAMTTKKDFTMMGGAFFLFMSSICVLGLFNWFFRTPLADALLFGAGCLIEGFYLIWDIQMICGQ